MSTDNPVNPKSLKVVELRDELEKRGLETTGLKKDLVDRLTKAQDTALSGGTELAPLSDEVKDAAVPLGSSNNAVTVNTEIIEEDAVGHSMVEGVPEAIEEAHEKVDEKVMEEDVAVQPAALDSEVAKVVAEEEMKDARPPTPSPPRAISPLPVPEPEPEMQNGDEEEMVVDGDEYSNRKRPRSEPSPSPEPQPKRPKPTYDTPLPPTLSHLIHPPTSTLYITKLRRPLLHPALHDYLFPSSTPSSSSKANRLPSPRQPFASPDYPGLWLSGVKDHAYATYPSVMDALEAAERMESVKWPEDTGDELHIEFIPDEMVREWVEREEGAWSNGRSKLSLKISKSDDGEVEFDLVGGGGLGAKPVAGRSGAAPISGPNGNANGNGNGNGRMPYAPQLSGRVIPGAPTGPANLGIRGRALPPHLSGTGTGVRGGAGGAVGTVASGMNPERAALLGVVPRGGGLRGGERDNRTDSNVKEVRVEEKGVDAVRRTTTRPFLLWRYGPGAKDVPVGMTK